MNTYSLTPLPTTGEVRLAIHAEGMTDLHVDTTTTELRAKLDELDQAQQQETPAE